MVFNKKAKISAIGAYLPEEKLTNNDFSKMVDTSDEWIYPRTGIKERRISGKNEYSSDMAIKAVENLIANNDVHIDDVDLIIVSTITQDYCTPSVAAVVQSHFEISGTGSLDMNSACSGYVYGMQIAFSMITSGQYKKVLLITADTLSKMVDYKDRSTCVLFGDAATATLIEASDEVELTHSFSGTNGTLGKELFCSSFSEYINGKKIESPRILNQNGRALYSYVTRDVAEIAAEYLSNNNIGCGTIDWFVPHSANARMISRVCDNIGISYDKTLLSLKYYGNTSSNSIPLALWDAINAKKIKRGDKMFLLGFGGGFAYAGLIFKL